MTVAIAYAVRDLCGASKEAPYASFQGSRRALARKLLAEGFEESAINATLQQLADANVLKLHANHLKWNEPKWQAYCRKALVPVPA